MGLSSGALRMSVNVMIMGIKPDEIHGSSSRQSFPQYQLSGKMSGDGILKRQRT